MTDIQQVSQLDTTGYVTFKDRHLTFQEDTPYEVWAAVVKHLKRAEKNIQWWIGDAIRFGERRYGETYSQALEETDYAYDSLSNMAYVASRFESSRRRDNLPFSHHAEVAPLPEEEQDRLLDSAVPKPGESKPQKSARQLGNEARGTQKMITCAKCGEVYPLTEATIRTEAKPA